MHLQPPSVDFIDNRLQDCHQAFRNSKNRYNPTLGGYEPVLPFSSMAMSLPAEPASKQQMQPRKLLPSIEAMVFWKAIFVDSMEKFKEDHPDEPKHLPKGGYNIRDKESWEQIYSQLQRARETYDGTKKGLWGSVQRNFRRVTDNSGSLKQLIKFIPNNDYVSPVMAVVEVLVDVSCL